MLILNLFVNLKPTLNIHWSALELFFRSFPHFRAKGLDYPQPISSIANGDNANLLGSIIHENLWNYRNVVREIAS